MANKSKVKGTRQETSICNVINDYVGAEIAQRLPLHGSEDQGDLSIRVGRLTLIGESKHGKTYPSEGLLEDYKAQTVRENKHSHGDGGLLFINLPNRSIMRMEVWLQRSTHYKLEMHRVGIQYPNDIPLDEIKTINKTMQDSEYSWRRLTMFDFLHEYFDHPAWEDRRTRK